MRRCRGNRAVDQLHQRLGNLIWGLLLIGVGSVLTLHQMGVSIPLPRESRPLDFTPERAVDGDPETRWSSQFDDGEWISVDLGEPREIARLRLVWERAYARVYDVQVSDDGSSWQTVVHQEEGQGGTEEHTLDDVRARWVRVRGIERSTPYGISLYELEAYGPGDRALEEGGALLSRGQPATASSIETQSDRVPFFAAFWMVWWPVVIIAIGIPGLLAPRSDGEETGAAITMAAGALFLLGNFGWHFRQTAPIALVMVGVVILVQGARRSRRREATPEDGSPGAS
jgi:F5/8 type C domain/LiaF transmembrane domain